jgi:putative membrane-bound dehydrogenase-like protein
MLKRFCLLASLTLFCAHSEPALAQGKKKKASQEKSTPTPEQLLQGIKAPPGFQVTLFAAPPEVNYPTCLACAPTGEVFIGIDQNGSLDAKPDRGRVLRCLDTDGDGKMDKHTVFCKVDSPRGLFFDHKTLYVLHPPFLTAFHDDDGDGVADRSEVLVTGIGFDLKFRGADHTTNGIRMGIDGWIYIAVGDYGFVKAQGKDGRTAQLHGGGIARVRPDGSGLEVYATGLRNTYDVAIDPLMNIFTRDNTNDGGGWDVRLSHIIPTGNYGYPSLFQRFADEIVQPLADYGGGSPTGSLYLDEPGFPEGLGR